MCSIGFMEKPNKIIEKLLEIFPDAQCELHYQNVFQLLIAVVLSAQTTDKRVNMVTEELFLVYPTAEMLADALLEDVKRIIASLGLYHTKAKNIINLSKKLIEQYRGRVPDTIDELMSLPGVGRKTANVVLSVGFHQPAIAVDTHVARVANRLGIIHSDDVYEIEMALRAYFDEKDWSLVHHLFIHYGRYICTARNPDCKRCPFGCPHQIKK
ncbi:MAG: endonuclease III [Bacilli bacterium]|nr:endonuclease III [Bacilli bacterium]